MTGQPDIAAALAWSGEAARAVAYTQAALRGEPVPALLISSEAHLAEAEASPANPYGSSKHGRFDAASPAEAGRCPGEMGFLCYREAGHNGAHHSKPAPTPSPAAQIAQFAEIIVGAHPAPDFCPAQWGEPPETMLCSLPSGHGGNHAAAEGVEWGGRWETAEPGDVTS